MPTSRQSAANSFYFDDEGNVQRVPTKGTYGFRGWWEDRKEFSGGLPLDYDWKKLDRPDVERAPAGPVRRPLQGRFKRGDQQGNEREPEPRSGGGRSDRFAHRTATPQGPGAENDPRSHRLTNVRVSGMDVTPDAVPAWCPASGLTVRGDLHRAADGSRRRSVPRRHRGHLHLMQLFFAGAEVTSHFAILAECGVERVAVSATNLARVAKDKLPLWASRSRLAGLEWVLYADSDQTPVSTVTGVLSGAEVQPEAVAGPIEWYDTTWLKDSDLQFLPTWEGTDPAKLREYAEDFSGVMLPDAAVDNPSHVRAAKAALPTLGILGALTGRTKGLERFDMLCSSAWWAVQKHGETQIWTGDRFVRLNAEDKIAKRQKYADAIEALGCDVDRVLADDPSEMLRLAVKSWLQLEEHLASGRSPRWAHRASGSR